MTGHPGVGTWGRELLQATVGRSNSAIRQLAPDIQWIESAIADDKTFCSYLATDESVLRKHSQIAGFPISRITEIHRMIGPLTEGDEGPVHRRRNGTGIEATAVVGSG